MVWHYFVRDFYRAAHAAPQSHYRAAEAVVDTLDSAPSSHISNATITAMQPVPTNLARERSLEQFHQAIPSIAPLQSYLQRLSVDGDHAFGIWDAEAGFSMFSANFERVTGLSTGDCAGHDWIHAIHHNYQYNVNEALIQAQQGMDGRCLVQAYRDTDETTLGWLMLDIKAPTARQPSTMVLFRDMTEHKALEEALKQTQAALAMSEHGRAAFLASMSHELRTPLNAIMGFSEMMKAGVFGQLDNPTYAQYAHHIHESGTTLLAKINDLLDIASMDSSGLELSETEFALAPMLNEIIAMHSHKAFSRNQTISLDCASNIILAADRSKLICALSHLVGNALRHSPEGAEIKMLARISHDEGIIVSVRDHGEGIPVAQMDIIRTALAADNSYYNIECGGIGLGLSLAREITIHHGGRVMIDSIRHRGTCASLIFPLDRVMAGMPAKRKRAE